jgi:SAM-dependent methyltransferase
MQEQWFESWFDSPWYPILYSHRDYAEAEAFISQLLAALAPADGARFLDLACGRGRHAIYIHRHGYDVTGLDLSAASIADAKRSEEPGLRFATQDMRQPIAGQYDYILNLFTSFGYFQDLSDNLAVLRNVAASLAPGGTFVLDFFNVADVLRKLVPAEEIERQGVAFSIRRKLHEGCIVKSIHLADGAVTRDYEERVQALGLPDFEQLFATAGLQIEEIWGDYAGHRFQEAHSPRLILFARHAATATGASA